MGLFSRMFEDVRARNAEIERNLQLLVDDIVDTIRKNQIDIECLFIFADFMAEDMTISEPGAGIGDHLRYRFADHGFSSPSDPERLAYSLAQRLNCDVVEVYNDKPDGDRGTLRGYRLDSRAFAQKRREEEERRKREQGKLRRC